jgi:hypothetical protein
VGCLLLLLIFFYICVIIAISGHTNATLVSNGCLEEQKWEIVETNLSIKTTYWNENELAGMKPIIQAKQLERVMSRL